jgi:purine-binding chemotaxis protein CheW
MQGEEHSMSDNQGIQLPDSGLAEDILAKFIDKAQSEVESTVAAQKVQGETLYHLVTFRLMNEEYGIEIGSVQEIIRATDITPVPGAPSHVKGVINLRGKIIPVVDLRKRFSLPEAEGEDEDQRIVVVELGEKRLGMLVDSVSQVLKLSSSVIEDMPEEAIAVDENYIKGVGKLDNRLIIILDLKRSLLML